MMSLALMAVLVLAGGVDSGGKKKTGSTKIFGGSLQDLHAAIGTGVLNQPGVSGGSFFPGGRPIGRPIIGNFGTHGGLHGTQNVHGVPIGTHNVLGSPHGTQNVHGAFETHGIHGSTGHSIHRPPGSGGLTHPHGGIHSHQGQVHSHPVGVHGQVSPGLIDARPPHDATCIHWCQTPERSFYCCKTNKQGPSPVHCAPKRGSCPSVRPKCPDAFTKVLGPPKICSTDCACSTNEKCCFDRCLERHVCKEIQYGHGQFLNHIAPGQSHHSHLG